jgi:glycerophosphoryl diester phosphodiesterase
LTALSIYVTGIKIIMNSPAIGMLKLASIIMLYINTPGLTQDKPLYYARERVLQGRTKVFAHRGGGLEGYENSKSSIIQAEKLGVDGIEIDVRRTLKGELVLVHDENLMRITGQDKNVSEIEYADIGPFKHDLESDYGETYYGDNRTGERPPLLEDILDFVNSTNLLVTINIHSDRDADTINVMNMVKAKGLLGRIFVNSTMDSETIKLSYGQNISILNGSEDLYAHYLNFLTGALAHQERFSEDVFNTSFNLETIKNSPYYHIPIGEGLLLSDALELAEQRYKSVGIMFEYYQRKRVPVMLYLCNTERDYNTALSLGVNIIVTDKPADLIAYMRLADREHAMLPNFNEDRETVILEMLDSRNR